MIIASVLKILLVFFAKILRGWKYKNFLFCMSREYYSQNIGALFVCSDHCSFLTILFSPKSDYFYYISHQKRGIASVA